MAVSAELLVAVAIGIGLAAAAGFRAFIPLLVAGLAARLGVVPLADGFEWLSTTVALVALATASVVEVAAYLVPGVDHALDVVASPVAIVAGVIASASVMVDMPPIIAWPLSIIVGGGIASATKVTSALIRAKTGLATAGLANPVVSASETAGAVGIAIAAVAVPLLCLLGLVVLLVWVVRRQWVRGGLRVRQ